MSRTDDTLSELAVRMWEEPLATRIRERDRLDDHVIVALTIEALRTEIEMGGLFAYLENAPLGFTLTNAIHACDVIGARASGDRLREVERLMAHHGVTQSQLRADLDGLDELEIATRAELHPGDEVSALADDLEEVGEILTDELFARRAAHAAEHERLLRALV